MLRHKIDAAGLRNLALTVNLVRLSNELGVTRRTLYRFMVVGWCKQRAIALRVNAGIKRLGQRSQLCEIVAAGLNTRANNRLSVRSKQRGPMTTVEVLRYPLGPIDQRYDASTHTLLVSKTSLHDILDQSSLIQSRPIARADLLARNLISPLVCNLATGIAYPHRTVDAFSIDLNRIEWATLHALVQESAKRTDPCDTGVVYTRRYQTGKSGIQGMQQAVERATDNQSSSDSS